MLRKGGLPCNKAASHLEVVIILLVTPCSRNQDKVGSDKPFSSTADSTFHVLFLMGMGHPVDQVGPWICILNNIFPSMKKHVRFFVEPWMRYWPINYDYYCGFKVIIVISTSFSGAFWCVNGIDYYLENGRVLYYSISVLYGKWRVKMSINYEDFFACTSKCKSLLVCQWYWLLFGKWQSAVLLNQCFVW